MQTRLNIILETVSQILESNRARRTYTKELKDTAYFDAKNQSDPETGDPVLNRDIPFFGGSTQRMVLGLLRRAEEVKQKRLARKAAKAANRANASKNTV